MLKKPKSNSSDLEPQDFQMVFPFPEEMKEPDVLALNEIRLFGDVCSEMTVKFLNDWERVNNNLLIMKLKHGIELPIKITISTDGGDVSEGMRIIARIETSKIPVHIYADGVVASMGLYILVSGTKRFSYPHTRFLLHEISSGFVGKVKDMKDNMKYVTELQEEVESYLSVRCEKITDKWVKEKSTHEYWFNNFEAMELGVIHEIL